MRVGDEHAVGGLFHDQRKPAHGLFGNAPLAPHPGIGQLPVYRRYQAGQIALHDIVLCTCPHADDRSVFADGAGNENEGNVGIVALDDIERARATEIGHRVIREHDVPFLLECLQQFGLGVQALPFKAEVRALQIFDQQQGIVLRVFYDQGAYRDIAARFIHDGFPQARFSFAVSC